MAPCDEATGAGLPACGVVRHGVGLLVIGSARAVRRVVACDECLPLLLSHGLLPLLLLRSCGCLLTSAGTVILGVGARAIQVLLGEDQGQAGVNQGGTHFGHRATFFFR